MTEICANCIRDWLKSFGGKYILTEENKLGEEISAFYKDNTIYLTSQRYNSPIFAPRMYLSISGMQITIEDILMKTNNIGNGTIAMHALLKLAKSWGIKEIVGFMSDVDEEHAERRNHYYEKFGFRVDEKWARLTL